MADGPDINNKHNWSDHDLLIRLDTKFSNLDRHMNSIWNTVNDKLANITLQFDRIEEEIKKKADRDELKSIDGRVKKLEQYKWWLVGAFTAAGTIGGLFGDFFSKYLFG